MGQELLEAAFDGGAETLLLSIGQEPDPSAPPAFLRMRAARERLARRISLSCTEALSMMLPSWSMRIVVFALWNAFCSTPLFFLNRIV